MASKGGTESPFSWRWTTVTWRVLNFPCRFAVGYQLEDRNVGKNPISHSISCPVREIQPRTGATLQETLVGESASISLCTTWWLPHLLHQVNQDFFPPFIDLDQRYPFDRGSHLSCNRLSWHDRIPPGLYIMCTYIYSRKIRKKESWMISTVIQIWFYNIDNRKSYEKNKFWFN